MVECKDCRHFLSYPGGTPWKPRTGCYHPDHMVQKQTENYLKAQEVPGNHEKINADGQCATFEPRPRKPSMMRRLIALMSS